MKTISTAKARKIVHHIERLVFEQLICNKHVLSLSDTDINDSEDRAKIMNTLYTLLTTTVQANIIVHKQLKSDAKHKLEYVHIIERDIRAFNELSNKYYNLMIADSIHVKIDKLNDTSYNISLSDCSKEVVEAREYIRKYAAFNLSGLRITSQIGEDDCYSNNYWITLANEMKADKAGFMVNSDMSYTLRRSLNPNLSEQQMKYVIKRHISWYMHITNSTFAQKIPTYRILSLYEGIMNDDKIIYNYKGEGGFTDNSDEDLAFIRGTYAKACKRFNINSQMMMPNSVTQLAYLLGVHEVEWAVVNGVLAPITTLTMSWLK